MPAAVRFGVNYTPSEGWFHHWLDFDLDSVRADLDSIAAVEAGLRAYDGALLVVSHDEAFLQAVGVTRSLVMPG